MVIFEDTKGREQRRHKQIKAAEGVYCTQCDKDDEEVEIAELIRNHINYRRSNDIEMMTNAER